MRIFETEIEDISGWVSARFLQFEAARLAAGRSETLKTKRITIETERLLVIRHATAASVRCSICGQSEFLTLDQAESFQDAIGICISELLKSGKLHFFQQENGPTLICLSSFLRCFGLDGNSRIRIAKEVI